MKVGEVGATNIQYFDRQGFAFQVQLSTWLQFGPLGVEFRTN